MSRYQKPAAYSNWHIKNLPHSCWYCDIDGVEVRKDKGIVGFFELVETSRALEDISLTTVMQEKGFVLDCVLFPISRAMNIPVYVVYHQKSCKKFHLFEFESGLIKQERSLDEKDYLEWVKSLGS